MTPCCARLPLTNTRSTSLAKPQSGKGSLPEKIGKYAIINEVGRGSTGVVYLSHDPYYGRDVAIKVYNVEASGDEIASASPARCFCPKRTWSACFSIRTFCRFTTPVKRMVTATS